MKIWVFGNADLAEDALPIRMLPSLKKAFPKITFIIQDPLDEWDIPEKLLIIDTVKGLTRVERFGTLDAFSAAPRVTMHDFDLYTQLAMLKKLGKLPSTTIFGIPLDLNEDEAVRQLGLLLRQL